jgi:IS5 family transposase
MPSPFYASADECHTGLLLLFEVGTKPPHDGMKGAPRQAAADGDFATRGNLDTAKAGVSDMAFHKKAGLRIEDMVRSEWVYRKLRNFRAGIEAGISYLKRAYGLARCTWRGLDHFKAYVWSSVVAYNLVLFIRLKPT